MTALDWRDASHYSTRGEKCVHCGERTRLRNDVHRPAHKVCQEMADQAEQKASN